MNTSPKTPKTPNPKNKFYFLLFFTSLGFLLGLAALLLTLINAHTASREKSALKQEQQKFLLTLENQQNAYREEIILRIKQNELSLNQLLTQSHNISLEQAKAESDSLIDLAKLKLQYTANLDEALELLQLAEQKLAPFHTPEIDEQQQQLKQAIETLKKMPHVHPAELLGKIEALMQDLWRTPLIHNLKVNQPILYSTSTASSVFWEKIKSNLEKIKSFITIRRIDDEARLALSPGEKQILKQMALAKLSLAEWAVLNQQPMVYQQSLQSTKILLASLALCPSVQHALTMKIDELLAAPLLSRITLSTTPSTTTPFKNTPGTAL